MGRLNACKEFLCFEWEHRWDWVCSLLWAFVLLGYLLSSGCAYASPTGRLFIGWGHAKFQEGELVEIKSQTPLDLGGIQLQQD